MRSLTLHYKLYSITVLASEYEIETRILKSDRVIEAKSHYDAPVYYIMYILCIQVCMYLYRYTFINRMRTERSRKYYVQAYNRICFEIAKTM